MTISYLSRRLLVTRRFSTPKVGRVGGSVTNGKGETTATAITKKGGGNESEVGKPNGNGKGGGNGNDGAAVGKPNGNGKGGGNDNDGAADNNHVFVFPSFGENVMFDTAMGATMGAIANKTLSIPVSWFNRHRKSKAVPPPPPPPPSIHVPVEQHYESPTIISYQVGRKIEIEVILSWVTRTMRFTNCHTIHNDF